MIAVRLDESGTHKEWPVCVVAGYLTDDAGLERLEWAWRNALRKHGYPRIHMRELEAGRTELSAPERKIPLFRDAIEILRQHALAGIAGYVIRSDYEKYVGTSEYGRYYSPYSLCVMLCAHAAQVWANMHGRGSDRISFMLDRGSKCGKEAHSMLNLMADHKWKTEYKFEPLAWGSDEAYPSLQAADMIAYEAMKHALREHNLPRAGPKVRELLKGLLGSVGHVALTPDDRFWIAIRSGIYPVDALSPRYPQFPDVRKSAGA
jgi:Protein of unknown function (DUF3800)